jgi:hypothetical protein
MQKLTIKIRIFFIRCPLRLFYFPLLDSNSIISKVDKISYQHMNTTGNAPHNTPLLKQLIQNGSTKSAKTAPKGIMAIVEKLFTTCL